MGEYFRSYRILLLVLFGVFSLPIFGQRIGNRNFEILWKEGSLITTSGDTIYGAVRLSLPNDIVQITQAHGETMVFTPDAVQRLHVKNQILSGGYYVNNGPLQEWRIYRSFIWNHDQDYSNFRTPGLFAVLVNGKHTLLMREELNNGKNNINNAAIGVLGGPLAVGAVNSFEYRPIIEKFYLLLPNQQLKPLRRPKQDLLKLLPEKKELILSYARANNINFNKPLHLAEIVAYANTL